MFKSFSASDNKIPGREKRTGAEAAGGPAVPQSVRRAVWLMYAGAATMTVFFITALTTMGSFKNAVITANKTAKKPMTPSQINGYVNGYTLYVIVVGLISIGLWLWMARMNSRGKNWARVTATILLCLWTINTIGVVQTRVIESMIFPAIAWLFGAASVFFLWRQESSAFFGEVTSARLDARAGGSGGGGQGGGLGGGFGGGLGGGLGGLGGGFAQGLQQLLPWRKGSASPAPPASSASSAGSARSASSARSAPSASRNGAAGGKSSAGSKGSAGAKGSGGSKSSGAGKGSGAGGSKGAAGSTGSAGGKGPAGRKGS